VEKEPEDEVRVMDIRRATEADAAAICALQQEIQALHAQGLPQVFRPPDTAAFSPEHVRSLLGAAGVRLWIAHVGTSPAGYLYAEVARYGENAQRKAQSYVYVNHVCVTAAHRRAGIGRALMEAAYSWAREESVDAVMLDVWGFNAGAQAFFAKEGFMPFTLRLSKPLR